MKKMNYLIGLLLLVPLVFGLSAADQVSAAEKVSIKIDENLQDYSPVIKDGVTFIPFRDTFESLGANIKWNGKNKTVTAEKGGASILAQLGNGDIIAKRKNGQRIVRHYSAYPHTINGITIIPVRVFEQLGATVSWNAQNNTIQIDSTTSMFKEFMGIVTVEDYKKIEELSTVWANALKTRDGRPRYEMMSDQTKEKFKREQINTSGENWNYIIGDSSPWVVDFEIKINGMKANITYLTQTSEPAYYETKETLTFVKENGKIIVADYQIVLENKSSNINKTESIVTDKNGKVVEPISGNNDNLGH